MFVTIPTFTIFNKIKVVVRLCGQLAGHECAAARPSYPAARQHRPTHCTDYFWELVLVPDCEDENDRGKAPLKPKALSTRSAQGFCVDQYSVYFRIKVRAPGGTPG